LTNGESDDGGFGEFSPVRPSKAVIVHYSLTGEDHGTVAEAEAVSYVA
jgi:hypothetical protein